MKKIPAGSDQFGWQSVMLASRYWWREVTERSE
jgi:hypothetical protein